MLFKLWVVWEWPGRLLQVVLGMSAAVWILQLKIKPLQLTTNTKFWLSKLLSVTDWYVDKAYVIQRPGHCNIDSIAFAEKYAGTF